MATNTRNQKQAASANFEAMAALARRLTEVLAEATETAAEAGGVDHPDEQNLLVGTLLPLQDQLAAAQQMLTSILTLHRLPRKGG